MILIKPTVFGDERGFFCETFRHEDYAEAGIGVEFVQENHSRSGYGILRGLHFQLDDQAKLIRVSAGRIWDVAVDVRKESPTYRKWVAAELSDENMNQLFVPVGFAHGFVVLSEIADVAYKVGPAYYDPALERGVRWNDPDIAVQWPVDEPKTSQRDDDAPSIAEIEMELPW